MPRHVLDLPNYVEGAPLYSYGHSYTSYPGGYCTPYTGEYMERLRRRLQMGQAFYRGKAGSTLVETVASMLSPTYGVLEGVSGPRTWDPASRGIVLLQNYTNEAALSVGSNTNYRLGWKHSLRTALAMFGSASVIPMSSATLSGTWTRFAGASSASTGLEEGRRYWNDDLRSASATGATASFSVTGDTAYVLTTVGDTGRSIGSLSFKVGTTTLATFNGTSQGGTYPSVFVPDLGNLTMQSAVVKVTGMNAAGGGSGAKTLVVTTTNSSPGYVGGVILPSSTPPHVWVAKEPVRGPQATDQDAATAMLANRGWFNTAIDDVCAEFPSYVHTVDLNVGYDPATMSSPLDTPRKFHPGDLGMIAIASSFEKSIRSVITSHTPGILI